MKSVFILLFCIPMLTYAQYDLPEGYSIRELKSGAYIEDNSAIYEIPFAVNDKVWVVQAYDARWFSHKDELSLDFKIKVGTPIHAARSGKVIEVKKNSEEGGLKEEHLSQGNHIIVLHGDSTYAGYWHLAPQGALVQAGDSVTAGQQIGLSGNTGYTAFPHLHFFVFYNNQQGERITLPTRFYTNKGVRYLRPTHFYKRPEKGSAKRRK